MIKNKYKSNNSQFLSQVIIFSIVLLGAYLRFHYLGIKNVYGDECLTVERASMSFWDILKQYPLTFLHYILVRAAFLLFGVSIESLRFFSLLLGVLSIYYIWKFTVYFFDNYWVGVLAAFLLAISPIHIEYSADGRYYSIMFFLSLCAVYYLIRGIGAIEWKWWAFWGIANLLNCLNHPFGWVLLVCELIVLVVWGGEKGFLLYRQSDRYKSKKLFIKDFIIVIVLLVGTVYFPLYIILPYLVKMYAVLSSKTLVYFSVNFQFIRNVFQAFSPAHEWEGFQELYIFFSLFIIGLLFGFKRRPYLTTTTTMICIIPFLFLVYYGKIGHFFDPKYVLFILPMYLVYIALAIVNLPLLLGNRIQDFKDSISIFLLLVIVCISYRPVVDKITGNVGTWEYNKMARYLETVVGPHDVIICDLGWEADAIKLNLRRDKQNTIPILGYIPTADMDYFLDFLKQYDNVWVVTQQKNIYNNDSWPWYSVKNPQGPFVLNPAMDANNTPEKVNQLNRLYINVAQFKGLSLFELRRARETKYVRNNMIGENYRKLEAENFYDMSTDLSSGLLTLKQEVPLGDISYIKQKLFFERTGLFDFIFRYKVVKPSKSTLKVFLDNQNNFTFSIDSLSNWTETTVQQWMSSGIHPLEINIRDKKSIDPEPKVLLDNVKISLDEPWYFKQLYNPVRINYDNQFILIGHSIPPGEIKDNRHFKMVFIWKKIGSQSAKYHIISHIEDMEISPTRIQFPHDDVEITKEGYANYPNDWVIDSYTYETVDFLIPKDIPTGKYKIYTCIFDENKNIPIRNYISTSHDRANLGSLFIYGNDFASRKESLFNSLSLEGNEDVLKNEFRDARDAYLCALKIKPGDPSVSKKYYETLQKCKEIENYRVVPLADNKDKVSGIFNDSANLLDVDFKNHVVVTDSDFKITLFWKCLDVMSTSYQVIVHLDGESEGYKRVDASHQPAGGLIPTDRWIPGDLISDTFYIHIPANTPSGSYRLWVGLFDDTTGNLPVRTSQLVSGNRMSIGECFVLSKDKQVNNAQYSRMFYKQGQEMEKQNLFSDAISNYTKAYEFDPTYTEASVGLKRVEEIWDSHQNWLLDKLPESAISTYSKFSGNLELIGYRLNSKSVWKNGEQVHLTYYWRPLDKCTKEIFSYTHIIHDKTGYLISPYYPVHYQLHPATGWIPGKIVKEELYFTIPSDAPAGIYSLKVGMWDNIQNLSVVTSIHEASKDDISLAHIGLLSKSSGDSTELYQEFTKWGNQSFDDRDYFESANDYRNALYLNPNSVSVRQRYDFSTACYHYVMNPIILEPPKNMIKLEAEFNHESVLLGYTLDKKAYHQNGDVLLTYYWKIAKPLDKNFYAFTHLDYTGDDTTFRISPYHFMANSFYPMKEWKKNAVIRDSVIFPIPKDTPPGKYRIITGLFDVDKNLDITNGYPNYNGVVTVGEITIDK